MTTAIQAKSNRENAAKSTGPRTAEGKAAVAGNALQHGLACGEVVLSSEDRDQFEAFRAEMLADMNLVGRYEHLLAERIVQENWRLRRALRIERQMMDRELQRGIEDHQHFFPDDPPDLSVILTRRVRADFAHDGQRFLLLLSRYHADIERALYRAARQLRMLQRERRLTEQGMREDKEPAVSKSRRDDRSFGSEAGPPPQPAPAEDPPAGPALAMTAQAHPAVIQVPPSQLEPIRPLNEIYINKPSWNLGKMGKMGDCLWRPSANGDPQPDFSRAATPRSIWSASGAAGALAIGRLRLF